jgi:hypothetical protein
VCTVGGVVNIISFEIMGIVLGSEALHCVIQCAWLGEVGCVEFRAVLLGPMSRTHTEKWRWEYAAGCLSVSCVKEKVHERMLPLGILAGISW